MDGNAPLRRWPDGRRRKQQPPMLRLTTVRSRSNRVMDSDDAVVGGMDGRPVGYTCIHRHVVTCLHSGLARPTCHAGHPAASHQLAIGSAVVDIGGRRDEAGARLCGSQGSRTAHRDFGQCRNRETRLRHKDNSYDPSHQFVKSRLHDC